MKSKATPKESLEPVTGKGFSIPIYKATVEVNGTRYDSFMLSYYKDKKRIRERAKTEGLARKRAKEIIEELAGSKPDDPQPFSSAQIRTVRNAVETLAPLKIPLSEAARTLAEANTILEGRGTLQEAARLFVKNAKKDDLPEITFGELYDNFMATLASDGDAKTREYKRSFRYWQDCSQRLGAAAEVFKDRPLSEITTRDLEAFLDKLPVRRRTGKGVVFTGEYSATTGRTRNNYRGAFCTIFSYARKMGYLPRGIETEAEHVLVAAENKTKQERAAGLQRRIYTPAEMQKILDELPVRWTSLVVLGAFAGLRTAEIHRLTWLDVNFEDKIITVEKHQAKVGKRRIVRMSPQLVAWLEPLAEEDGWICPHFAHDSTLNIEFTKERSKIAVPIVPNGHRHSYASYRLTEIKIPSEVAWEMNTSERKLRDNYLALVNDRELAEWKKVLPKAKKP